ncbi:MAG: glutathionylspermidine synthase family protein [Deltaproteobacteria bacterium]|nr:glutathionylspermidine synthase family protein [Deltaproteobacteria bacterium]
MNLPDSSGGDVRLHPIPPQHFAEHRRRVIFSAFKWDPQVGDTCTVADHVVILRRQTALRLHSLAESLAEETVRLEGALRQRPDLHGTLGLPGPLIRALRRAGRSAGQSKRHVRVMRFDFHPTVGGQWVVSEVNSDVPGGYAEASLLPGLAARFAPQAEPFGPDVGTLLAEQICARTEGTGAIGLVHATSYADDRQVMAFLARKLTEVGRRTALIAPDHVRWSGGARCIAHGQEGELAAIMRFFPAEWLHHLPRACEWHRYFSDGIVSCNHASVVLTQSKRLPLVWDQLGVPLTSWPQLLPETSEPSLARINDGWLLKPAMGRVGQGITIPECTTLKERRLAALSAFLHRRDWVAQRRFASRPLQVEGGGRHLCIGVFTVNGRAAGFYGRLGIAPRIDEKAQDVPVLVEREESNSLGGLA